MIDIPISDIKRKITEQKGLAEPEIDARIKEKLRQLAGLISEEGAAHIVANELGVELIKHGGEAKVGDLYAGMRAVTVPGRVVKKFDVREFDKGDRKGKVASFVLGDETGEVRVTLWNDQTELHGQFAEGDVVRVKNGYVKENRGQKELHLNTESRLEIKPSGVAIAEAKRGGARAPRERKLIKDLAGEEENVELLATVVQLYDPRYFDVDAATGKKVVEGFQGKTQANYVVNAFLDDGTGNIRTTFWKQQAQRLLGKSDEEMLAYRDNPTAFEAVKTELLGEIVKVVGRCKKNETFDRPELVANLVFTEIDPEEELARLKEESADGVATLDAPAPVKEAIAKTLAEPKGATVVVEKELFDEEIRDVEHGLTEDDVISLDDLEDLDEKL